MSAKIDEAEVISDYQNQLGKRKRMKTLTCKKIERQYRLLRLETDHKNTTGKKC